ncbi:MAG: twin-arginine translocation signal domain-containing protein [Candidatus Pacebacteria bacterium]|nr:twin-arginine translocation signal domain-containing protein [Candidatus Paceibacterota bacterium]MBP9851226.1 twin-arginine translocation signal domain-containing protein [Candidatus Paceibacterota bacterium]
MGKEGFSNSRRNFLKTGFTLLAGAAALSALPQLAACERIDEKEQIKKFFKEYNEKYPTIGDKIIEQKSWFLKYMDSPIYKKLLTEEIKKDTPHWDEWGEFGEWVEYNIKGRRSLVENVIFVSKDDPGDHRKLYAKRIATEEMYRQDLVPINNGINEDPGSPRYPQEVSLVVINIESHDQSNPNPFWNNTVFCHELHHAAVKNDDLILVSTSDRFQKKLAKIQLKDGLESSYTEYVLDPGENMAAIIEARKALHDLGKMDGFKDKFTEGHIEYLKKYAKDIFLESTVMTSFLFSDYMKNNHISNKNLSDMMNNFAGLSAPEDSNSRMS